MEVKYYYFLTYSLVFVCYGGLVTGIGPTIPFISEVTHLDETHYSYIFLARAFGYILGGTITKQLTKQYSFHQLYVALLACAGASCILSSLSSADMNLAVWMLVSAGCCCSMSIITNLCIFKIFMNDSQDFWIQLVHTVFGVGGLLGPLAAVYFHEKSLMVYGVCFFAAIPPFMFLKSPELREQNRKSQAAHPLPITSMYCICVLYLLYIGSEVGLANWIPTYAVKLQVADAEGASFLSTIFWVTNTAFRIILLKMPGTVSLRLKILTLGLTISTLLMNILQLFSLYTLTAYLVVFTSGAFIASMYALFLAVSIEHGFKVTAENTANFMIASSLGEGVLIMPIGYAMGIFGSQALIVLMFVMALLMWITFHKLLSTYQDEKKRIDSDENLELGLIDKKEQAKQEIF